VPPSPYQSAVETLRRCQQGLAVAESHAERLQLLQLHDEALRLLEQSQDRRRLSTAALAKRIEVLERQMATYSPSDRAAAIRERLGLSRSHYYAIRKLRQSS
jgi:hypothetical protein